jgi:hypothetical protein
MSDTTQSPATPTDAVDAPTEEQVEEFVEALEEALEAEDGDEDGTDGDPTDEAGSFDAGAMGV